MRPSNDQMEMIVFEISNPNCVDFDEVVKIYMAAFPPEDREEISMIRELYSTATFPDKYHCIAVRIVKGGDIVGFVMFHYFANINAGFMAFIGTSAHVRGKNIGSVLVDKVKEVLHNDAQKAGYKACSGIFAEYEVLNRDVPQTVARCRFWHRHDLHPLNIGWKASGHEKDYYLSFMDLGKGSAHFTSAEMEDVARTIYKKFYGEKRVDDNPVVQQILDGIRKNDNIQAIPLNIHQQ